MSRIYKSVDELVGNTPVMELTHIQEEFDLQAKLFAKLEYLNPAGSVKDRTALAMIEDAEEKGILQPGKEFYTIADDGGEVIALAIVKG